VDAMSRWLTDSPYLEHQQELEHQEEINQSVATTVMQGCSESNGSDPQGDIYSAQLNDDIIGPILKVKLEGSSLTDDDFKEKRREFHQLAQQWDQLQLHNGLLYWTFEDNKGTTTILQLVAPKSMQGEILEKAHSGEFRGHLGEDKTRNRIKERFYWPGYYQSVREWCQACRHCAARKNQPNIGERALQSIKPGYPMQIVALDIMGPLPKSNQENRYILVISDYFTRWADSYGIPNQEAVTVANILVNKFFCQFGLPEQLHSDMGSQFESKIIQELCKIFSIVKTHTTPYHP